MLAIKKRIFHQLVVIFLSLAYSFLILSRPNINIIQVQTVNIFIEKDG